LRLKRARFEKSFGRVHFSNFIFKNVKIQKKRGVRESGVGGEIVGSERGRYFH
jgi:hypothetical protein